MAHLNRSAIAAAALVAAVVVFANASHAQQRLSLAERVERLEQQQSGGNASGSAVDAVNQISALQSQVQSLQGQVEELRHALDESKQRSKDQYVDLDSRIGRLEVGGAAAPVPAGRPAPRVDTQPPDVDLGNPGAAPPRATAIDRSNAGTLSDADRTAVPGDEPVAAAPLGQAGGGEASYNDAFSALKDGRYAESARKFQSFIDQNPDGELTGNAYYWLGESYYVTQNYTIALQSFETLLKRYPTSQKAPDALLKVGYSQYELKQWDQAENTLNQVVQTYPDTTVARLAQGRLRALKTETRR
ncbi:MAG: tol-pal system protein YbgF [Dokdonella sp.]|uniref:tol-pal system protein YbgF n=1 Tax=Dokdonella sp. TaxID=2291710 RepID=UPI003262EC60